MASPVAWISYLPVPGLAAVAVLLAPQDRLVRFHAWQGTIIVLLAYGVLVLLGLLLGVAQGAFAAVVGALAALWLLVVLVALAWGVGAALRGRFDRIPPAADLLSLLGR